MIPAKQFDLCPWGKLNAMPHMGWQHAGWFASYVVNAKNILEWGCGGSTLWMGQMNLTANIHVVEHQDAWIERIKEAAMVLRDSSLEFNWTHMAFTACTDASGYLAAGDRHSPYDLIFVDGQERPACLAASYDLLAPGGVVFLHDSQRTEYIDAKRLLLEREGMTLIDERLDESWVNPRAGMWAVQKHE